MRSNSLSKDLVKLLPPNIIFSDPTQKTSPRHDTDLEVAFEVANSVKSPRFNQGMVSPVLTAAIYNEVYF